MSRPLLLRVPDQNGISQACYIVEIHHSGPEPSILRLQTGHCGLWKHLKRTGTMDSALCDCKETEQTVHHILQDCSIWRQQRHQLWPQDEAVSYQCLTFSQPVQLSQGGGHRMSQPPTSCGERGRSAPHHQIQHVDHRSKHGWSTAEEEEEG